MFRIAS